MKKATLLLVFLMVFSIGFSQTKEIYDMDYVTFSSEKQSNGEFFTVIRLKRKNMRVRAKYFADEINGKSVAERYKNWSKNKNIICYSSGAYMSNLDANSADIVGLTIDYGTVVNKKLEKGRLDAMVVVYPNGEIDVVNLKNGKVTFSGSGSDKAFDMSSSMGVPKFIEWAKDEKLTVFQTHLLAYNNELKLASNSSSTARERRFLVVATNRKGEKVHFIFNKSVSQSASLLKASKAVVDYLKAKSYTVEALINLDTGAQDTFRFFNYDGTVNSKLKGTKNLSEARNLVVYYYE